MGIYYHDIIAQDELIINAETCVYLVQGNSANEFSIKAIQKADLKKLPFDPTTRAEHYWPLEVNHLLALESNQSAQSKIFYREHDSQRLILSSSPLTRADINSLLKIDPVQNHPNRSDSKQNTGVTKIQASNFASNVQSANHHSFSEEDLVFIVKNDVLLEGKTLSDRLQQLMKSGMLVHSLCDAAQPSERLPLIFTLKLIQIECENIKYQIDQLGITYCLYRSIYPHPTDENSLICLARTRRFSLTLREMIDNVVSHLLGFDTNHSAEPLSKEVSVSSSAESQQTIETDATSQPSNQAVTSGYGTYINTLANHCIIFFKQVMPAIPPNEPPAYPYNRTRVFL